MSPRRLTLASALLLSLLLHLLVMAGGEIPLPDFQSPAEDVLARRTPAHVQRVRLAARPPATAPKKVPAPGMRVSRRSPAIPDTGKKPAPSAPEAPRPEAAAISEPEPGQQQEQEPAPAPAVADADTAAEPPPDKTPAAPVAPEPAPAFPVQLSAGLEARVNGLSATLEQTWIMEGFRYAIEVKGSKFGYHALISSEGVVNPEGGLSPERSSLVLGGKVKSMTEYRDGNLRMGKPESMKDYPLSVVPQDFASIPFHLAVTFNGAPQTLLVSTGRRLYQTRFSLVAEETLRLPVGPLRTLHIAGERFDRDLRQMVQAFDIWLAPDYLNFPVKVTGHLNGGEPIEYRVRWLEIEGRRVLGKPGEVPSPGSDEVIPAWLKDQGLKNP